MSDPVQRPPLARLLSPRTVAVAGASAELHSVGNNILMNLERFGFAGGVYPVSRRGGEIGGRACAASIDELPHGIDAAVLAVPAHAVRESLEACARRGIGGAVVFASGFAEQDEAGRKAQEEFAAAAAELGLAVIGPNCIGFINYAGKAALTFEPVDPPPVMAGPGICVIAQSGAMSGNIRYALQGRGVCVSHSISTGNEAVVAAEDCADLLIGDPAVRAFALFVEQIRDPQKFLNMAARARAAQKPIVLLHSGRCARAREAAKTHTGALAGDYEVMRCFTEREGVILAEGLDELFDVCALLARSAQPIKGGVAVVSNSGALRGLGLDLCEDIGLAIPDFSPQTAEALKALLPSFATVDNPLDVTAAAMTNPSLFGDSLRAVMDDPAIGFTLVSAMGGGPAQQMSKWKALAPALEACEKPAALCYLGDDYPLDAAFLKEARASGVPFFRSPERALRAVGRIAAWSKASAAPRAAAQEPVSVPRVEFRKSGAIAEWRGKEILARCGIAVPRGRLVTNAVEARIVAGEISYPVALKAQADTLAHKSDAGGVVLGIANEEDLDFAGLRIAASVSAAAPDITLDGMLVESMAPEGGLEMIVGARRDPQWGPVLLIGLGGIWAEALRDVRLLPADASPAEILRGLGLLKGAPLLRGMRGAKPRDAEALAQLAVKIGALMIANPEIIEIDVNPVHVYAQGEGALALDAVIVTA